MKQAYWFLLLAMNCTFAWAGGEETYKETCAVCHAKGLAGAPQVGEKKLGGN